jgi:hypothetical protein
MDEQPQSLGDRESLGDGPYANHPVLSALPREVRQRIADQLKHDRKIGAIKTLRDALDVDISIKDAKDIIDGLHLPGTSTKLASGKIDKGGTTLTLYRDGTFTTTAMIFTSEPDRLVAFSSDIDSMRRKSVTGRGAAFLVTGGMSVLASNNRGVIYVTITGERSGTKTYTTRNPDDRTLSSIRSLQAAADTLLASQSAVVTASDEASTTTTQRNGDVATQLKMLAELHATGALSDEEFAPRRPGFSPDRQSVASRLIPLRHNAGSPGPPYGIPGGDPQGRHIRRRRPPGSQVLGVGRAGDAAISPIVRRCQAEYAARTSHEGLGGDRQEIPAGLPVGHPAEALQRVASWILVPRGLPVAGAQPARAAATASYEVFRVWVHWADW